MHLSNVDLPEPLWPTMPTVSPWPTVKLMLLRALKTSVEPGARVQETLLEGLVALVVDLEVLGDVLDVDDGDHLELRLEVALEAAEDGLGDEEEHDRDREQRRGSRSKNLSKRQVGRMSISRVGRHASTCHARCSRRRPAGTSPRSR